MQWSSIRIIVATALASFAIVSCGSKQPIVQEPDPFEDMGPAPPPPPPEPPPPPKCESFDEDCKAKPDTWLKVGEQVEFQPPEDWLYAKLENVSVAKFESDAAVGYRIVPSPLDPKKAPAGVIAALAPIFEVMSVEVTDAALKAALRKPGSVDPNGSLPLSTWDVVGKVGGKKGFAVVVLHALETGEGLVGVVASTDAAEKAHFGALQQSYRSVRSTP